MTTRNKSLILLSLGFLISLFSNYTFAQTNDNEIISQMIKAVESNLLPPVKITGEAAWTLEERMKYYKTQGISIAVIDDYEIQWVKAYGWADQKEAIPATTKTLFQAASISKSLNALGIMRLKEKGLVELDKDINDYLKSWKFPYDDQYAGHSITLTHLLSHTAGLSTSGFDGYKKARKLPGLVDILDGKKRANSEAVRQVELPGQNFRYSGGGTLISQLIAEDVSGTSYATFMQQEVLEMLGMKNSCYQLNDKANLQAASGHWWNGDRIKTKYHSYPELAAAGLWTTAEDLAMFVIAIQKALAGQEGSLIKPATAQFLTTPVLDGFAMTPGFFIMDKSGTQYFHNAGSNEGFTCHFFGSFKEGKGLVVMTNSERYEIISEIANSVAVTYDWKDFYNATERKMVDIAPGELEPFAGTYEFESGNTWQIYLQDNHLMLSRPNDGPVDLYPENKHFFFQKNQDEQLEFVANGESFDLLVHRNGRVYKANKKS